MYSGAQIVDRYRHDTDIDCQQPLAVQYSTCIILIVGIQLIIGVIFSSQLIPKPHHPQGKSNHLNLSLTILLTLTLTITLTQPLVTSLFVNELTWGQVHCHQTLVRLPLFSTRPPCMASTNFCCLVTDT